MHARTRTCARHKHAFAEGLRGLAAEQARSRSTGMLAHILHRRVGPSPTACLSRGCACAGTQNDPASAESFPTVRSTCLYFLYSYGLYSYGLYSYGLYNYGYIVMAFIVMIIIDIAFCFTGIDELSEWPSTRHALRRMLRRADTTTRTSEERIDELCTHLHSSSGP